MTETGMTQITTTLTPYIASEADPRILFYIGTVASDNGTLCTLRYDTPEQLRQIARSYEEAARAMEESRRNG